MNEKNRKIIKQTVTYIAVFLIPLLLFYLEAFFTYNPFVRTRWKAQVLNLIFLEMLFLILFTLIGRAVWALRIETALVLVIGLANYYVIAFRGTPIVPWDILSIKTAASVAGGYSYLLPAKQIVLTAVFILLFLAEGFLKIKLNRRRWITRLAAGIAAIAVICGMTWVVQQDEYVNKLTLYPFLFTPTVMYERNGFAVTFLMDLQYMSVEKPEGYSAEEAEETLASYEDGYQWLTDGTQKESVDDTSELPNIIVIMDEAFSDVGVLGDFTASEDYMPFVHSLQKGEENTITGYLNVSVKGGNTANTEFEFLTGSTMAFLPAGSIPYQQYITSGQPSLASYLKSLGYNTFATHPYYGTGWNRNKVYPLLGFDDFLDQTSYLDPSYVRGYIDDDSCVDKIIELYQENKEEAPSFIFNVTMQNHSPYTDNYSDPDGNISVEGTMSSTLSEYLTLIQKSDAALEKLIEYFKEQEDPTVIVFFGDHQPTDLVVDPIYGLNGESSYNLTDDDQALRYEVPYVVWANYDIDEASGVDTSANYLAANVLKAAGVPLSDYQNYLLDLQKEYPIISTQKLENADGGKASDEETAIQLYQKLQYYLLFDKKEES